MLILQSDPRDGAVQTAIKLQRCQPDLIKLWLGLGDLLARGSLGSDGVGKLSALVLGDAAHGCGVQNRSDRT